MSDYKTYWRERKRLTAAALAASSIVDAWRFGWTYEDRLMYWHDSVSHSVPDRTGVINERVRLQPFRAGVQGLAEGGVLGYCWVMVDVDHNHQYALEVLIKHAIPTVVVRTSERGCHVIWALDRCVTRERVRALQVALARKSGSGDEGNARKPIGNSRTPYTINRKDGREDYLTEMTLENWSSVSYEQLASGLLMPLSPPFYRPRLDGEVTQELIDDLNEVMSWSIALDGQFLCPGCSKIKAAIWNGRLQCWTSSCEYKGGGKDLNQIALQAGVTQKVRPRVRALPFRQPEGEVDLARVYESIRMRFREKSLRVVVSSQTGSGKGYQFWEMLGRHMSDLEYQSGGSIPFTLAIDRKEEIDRMLADLTSTHPEVAERLEIEFSASPSVLGCDNPDGLAANQSGWSPQALGICAVCPKHHNCPAEFGKQMVHRGAKARHQLSVITHARAMTGKGPRKIWINEGMPKLHRVRLTAAECRALDHPRRPEVAQYVATYRPVVRYALARIQEAQALETDETRHEHYETHWACEVPELFDGAMAGSLGTQVERVKGLREWADENPTAWRRGAWDVLQAIADASRGLLGARKALVVGQEGIDLWTPTEDALGAWTVVSNASEYLYRRTDDGAEWHIGGYEPTPHVRRVWCEAPWATRAMVLDEHWPELVEHLKVFPLEGRILVACAKGHVEEVRRRLGEGVAVAHYESLRSTNEYAEYDGLWILGQPMPAASVQSELLRRWYGDSSGLIAWAMCEDTLLQVEGRLRAGRRPGVPLVVVYSSPRPPHWSEWE